MSALSRLLAVLLAALGLSGAASVARTPAGVASIRIHSAAGVTITVTRPAAVAQIVKWFDALPPFVALPCPFELRYPPDVSFVFRDSAGRVLRRAVDHSPGSCASEVTYGTTARADHGFVADVSRLLGVSFDPNAQTEENAIAAKLDTADLLSRVRVPPSSERVAHSRTSRTWRVHLPVAEVFAWEQAHRPRGATEDGSGTGTKDGVVTDRELTYTYPPIPGRIAGRGIGFNFIVKPGGWTRIYAYADSSPVVARSPNEKVPTGVTQVAFRSHVITDPAKVANIVHWFDALPIVGPGIGSCTEWMSSAPVHLDFRDSLGHVLARAGLRLHYGLYSDRCSPISFTVGGHADSPLDGGNFFVRVAKLVR